MIMPNAQFYPDGSLRYAVPTEEGGSLLLTVTQPHDPAYALLMDPDVYSTPNLDIYRDNCYICRDPEFSQMGLPLCKPCEICKVGHVAADDTICDRCGADAQELYLMEQEKAITACKANSGHLFTEWTDRSMPAHIKIEAGKVTKKGWIEARGRECTRCPEHEYESEVIENAD
jgi:hypothetical protein